MLEENLNPALDNEPDQIQRPAQYPTATKIENGTAFDISGQKLGPVSGMAAQSDEVQGVPPELVAEPIQKSDDFFVSLGGKLVEGVPPGLVEEPIQKDDSFFQKLGGKIVPEAGPQTPTRPGETPGARDITGIRASTRHEIPADSFADPRLNPWMAPLHVAGNWFEDLKDDLNNGTDATWIGWLLRKGGAKGLNYGVAPGVMSKVPFLNAPEGIAKLGHAVSTLGEHPIKAANEGISAAGQILSPLALTQPEALPFMAIAGTSSSVASGIAKHMGADDEAAEIIGNVAGLVTGGKSIGKTHIDDLGAATNTPAKLTFVQRVWKLMRGAA